MERTEVQEFQAKTGLEPFDSEKLRVFFKSHSKPTPESEKLGHIIFCASLDTPCLWGGDGQVPVLAILSSDGVELGPRLMIRSAVPDADDCVEITGLPAVRALAQLWDLFPGAPCLRLEPPTQAFLKAQDLCGPLCLSWLREVDKDADWSGVQVSWRDVQLETSGTDPIADA
jgi:hypothetical protein